MLQDYKADVLSISAMKHNPFLNANDISVEASVILYTMRNSNAVWKFIMITSYNALKPLIRVQLMASTL